MSGFEAVTADMRAAAGEIGAAGEGVRDADPSGRVGDVASAMPGSQSAAAASSLAETWRTRFATWAEDADAQATRLRDAATDYDNADYLADVRLRQQMHRTGMTAY